MNRYKGSTVFAGKVEKEAVCVERGYMYTT